MKKNKVKVFVLLFLLGLLVSLGVSYSVNDGGKVSGEFSVQYDASWKVKNGNGLLLEHRKTGSILNIQSKKIDENYIDTELKYLINDIMYSIEEQNKDYKLINVDDNISDNYEAFSYLYEKEKEQVLVNVYKYDDTIVVAYYEADSAYYDIVLDSVDTILNSLEIS